MNQLDITNELKDYNRLLVILNERNYSNIISSIKESDGKICYVCLTRPYKDVFNDLKKTNINLRNFFFIDIMSSHYVKQKDTKNCIFIDSPDNLEDIKNAIMTLARLKKINLIIFDTLSALLSYNTENKILHFTNDVIKERNCEYCKKLFLYSKENGIFGTIGTAFVKDLELFTDKTIDFSNI